MSSAVTKTTSGLMELKTKLQEPAKYPLIKVIDVLIPSANTLSGLISIAAEVCSDKKSELTKIKDGVDYSNGLL